MQESTSDNLNNKKRWYKTWWGILILLGFSPFFISFWIWKREKWSKNLRLSLIAGLWVFGLIFGAIYSISEESYQKGYKAGIDQTSQFNSPIPRSTLVPTITLFPTVEPTAIPTVEATQIPTTEPTIVPSVPFDNSRGNNWVAAKYAVDMMNTANRAVPGSITDSFIELYPEEVKTDEKSYKEKVVSAFLTVEISNSLWNSLNESSKKDIVTTLVVSLGNIFRGGPHVKVTNGIRIVAEGEYNLFRTEPKITLK